MSNKYNSIQLGKNDFLVAQEIELPKTTTIKKDKQDQEVIQYIIEDRSGSRSYTLGKSLEINKKYVATLDEGQEVVLGFFSSQGQYGLSQPYVLRKQLAGVTATLDSWNTTLGCTCFNEILEEMYKYHKKNHPNKKAALLFNTDGMHNDGAPRQAILDILTKWKEFSAVSLFIGSGYLDREFMSKMAESCDGSFIHMTEFSEFEDVLKQFNETVKDSSPKVKVKLPNNVKLAVSISGKNIIEYAPDKQGIIDYSPSKKNKKVIYFRVNSSTFVENPLKKVEEHVEKGFRSLALVLSQKNKANETIDILANNMFGDKALIDKFNLAIAPEEFGKAEKLLRESIFNSKMRYKKGQVQNYLPSADAYTVLDFIEDLLNEDNAKLHLGDKRFAYNKIGSDEVQADGSKFEIGDSGVFLNDIVFNQERLNISINTVVNGQVKLDPKQFKTGFTKEDLKKYHLGDTYPVSRFRTYTLIADGSYSTYTLVLSGLSPDFVVKLENLEVIKTFDTDGKVVVDISSLPLGNKNQLKGNTSAKKLAQKLEREYELKTEQSVINAILKNSGLSAEEKEEKKITTTEDQLKFLEDFCYIKKGSYNPPVRLTGEVKTVKASRGEENEIVLSDVKDLKEGMHIFGLGKEAQIVSIDKKKKTITTSLEKLKLENVNELTFRMKDKYEAYRFRIGIEGLSPVSFSEYKKAKTITKRFELFDKFYKKWESAFKFGTQDITKRLKEIKAEMSTLRKEIQTMKFLIIMVNKGGMDEFSSRENMILKEGVNTFKFEISKIDVYI